MHTKVRKWGNSLALRIPKSFANDAHLATGSEVDLTLYDGKIIIDPEPAKEYSLAALLRGVTNKNLHSEIDYGSPAGMETW